MRSIKEMEAELSRYKELEKAAIRLQKGRMRRFALWVRYFLVSTWKWLFLVLRDWRSWTIFAIVATVMSSTVWVGFILYWVFGWAWSLAMATGSLFFWNCVPFTPFLLICLFITTAILKWMQRKGK